MNVDRFDYLGTCVGTSCLLRAARASVKKDRPALLGALYTRSVMSRSSLAALVEECYYMVYVTPTWYLAGTSPLSSLRGTSFSWDIKLKAALYDQDGGGGVNTVWCFHQIEPSS